MSRELQDIFDGGEVTDIVMDSSYAPTENYQLATLKYVNEKQNFDAVPLTIGDGGTTDYAEFESDGTLQFHGAATVWEDVVIPFAAYRLESVAGTLAYNWANNSITVSPSGTLGDDTDTLVVTYQIPHRAKTDSTAKFHLHWEQPADQAYTFSARYRIQRNGQAKATSWVGPTTVTTASNIFTYTSGTLIQITEMLDIDLTGLNPSDLIEIQFARTDATSGDIELISGDCHFECDTLGSRSEYSK